MKTLRRGICLMLSLALAGRCLAQEPPNVKLTGIVVMRGQGGEVSKRALLEIPQRGRETLLPILREGESAGDYDVTFINEQQGAVRIRAAGQETILRLPTAEPVAHRTFNLQGVHLTQALELFQSVAHCTLIRPSHGMAARIDLVSAGELTATEATQAFEAALRQKGMGLERRAKFIFVMPPQASGVLAGIPSPPPDATSPAGQTNKEEIFQAGLIRFMEADLVQLLDFYQELSGKTVLQAPIEVASRSSLKNETPLTRAQAVWMMDAVLAVAGTAMVAAGDKFVFAVPMAQTNVLSSIEHPPAVAATQPGAAQEEVFPAGLIKFQNTPPATVLEFYQELSGQTIVRPVQDPPARISVKLQTPLTRAEAVWTIRSLLRLAGLQIVPAFSGLAFAVPAPSRIVLPAFDEAAIFKKTRGPAAPAKLQFKDADLTEILETYASLVKRQPLPIPSNLPSLKVRLYSVRALSQAEAIFALEGWAAINNLRFQFVDEDNVGLAR